MPISLDTLLVENSEDFSEQEATKATPTASAPEIVTVLKSLSCSSCGARPEPTAYALRRWGPHLYWKMKALCPQGHETIVVVETDWLQGAR